MAGSAVHGDGPRRADVAGARRVAIVTPSLRGGGLERMVRDLGIALRARGESPAVFVLRGEVGVYATDLVSAGVPVHDCREGRARVPGLPRRLVRALRAFDPDVVHVHSGGWLAAALAAGRVDAPLVFTDHGRYPPESARLRMLQRWCLRRTARIVTVTASLASYVREFLHLPETPPVIPNGVDLAAYRVSDATVRPRLRAAWGASDADVLVVAVGRFAPVKNHLGLIDAFARAVATAPALRLVLVGSGALQAEAQARARTLGVGERVHFLGYRTDVRDCLAASDVFVNASTTEALPVSLIEAMAVGLPSVATAVGGVPDALGDPPGGVLVPAGDTPALGDALAALGTDAARRATLADRARTRARDFSLDAMADAYARLYDDVIIRSRP